MTAFLLALLAWHAAIWLLWFEVRFWRHYRLTPKLTHRCLADDQLPEVTILVPARNEEGGIEAAIRSLCSLDYPRLRVICANDHSTDETGAILSRLATEYPSRLLVLDVPELPDGWMGKCHALFHAVAHASKDSTLYLFTDADVIHGRDSLRRAVSHTMRESADLLAISPRVDCVGFWENAILAPFMHLGVAQLNPKHLNDPGRREIVGIGAFTLIRREMYESWGGHGAIRGETIDDMAMGLMTKRKGGRLLLVRDRDAVHLRMYTDLASIVRGFEKNMHTALGSNPLRTFFAGIGMAALHTTPLVVLLYALIMGPWWLGALALLLHLEKGRLLLERSSRFLSLNPAAVILGYPLGALLAVYILYRSAWHAEVGGVVKWRGRTLSRPDQETQLV